MVVASVLDLLVLQVVWHFKNLKCNGGAVSRFLS